MIQLRIDVKGIAETKRMFKRLQKATPEVLDELSEEFAKKTITSMKLCMRKSYWTGTMQETLRYKKIASSKDGGTAVFHATTEAPWFEFQETGFQPHIIHKSTPTGSGRKFEDWIREKYMTRHPELKTVPEFLTVKKPMIGSYYLLPAMVATNQNFGVFAKKILDKHMR